MKRLCLLLMFWAIPLYAEEPPSTPAPGIRLPELPPQQSPIIPPPPQVVPIPRAAGEVIHRLTADTMYVFDSDVDIIVTSSQLGHVDIKSEPGPLKIRGRFVDNTNISTRTFKGKTVYTIEPVKSGRIELIVIPIGAKTESELIRRTIDVDTGTPPVVDPPKPPVVDPPVIVPTKEMRVLFVAESSSNMTKEQLNVWNSVKIREYLDSKTVKEGNTVGYRFWDKDIDTSKELPVWKEIWAATKPAIGKLPIVVIFSGVDGKNYPLFNTDPTTGKITDMTETEVLALLKKYGGA